jgi:hypothetical protein
VGGLAVLDNSPLSCNLSPRCTCTPFLISQASEGIDFRDAQARAVVIIGIPYPAARDAKVVLKKGYNDLRRRMPATPPAPLLPVGGGARNGVAAAAAAAAATQPVASCSGTQAGPTQQVGGGFMLQATQAGLRHDSGTSTTTTNMGSRAPAAPPQASDGRYAV